MLPFPTPFRLPEGARVAVAGTARAGASRLLVLLDRHDQWAVTTAIPPGPFRAAINVLVEGEYKIVIANNLSAGQAINHVEVTGGAASSILILPAMQAAPPPRAAPVAAPGR